MLVIAKQTEAKLALHIKELSQHKSQQRCFHLALSQSPQDRHRIHSALLHALQPLDDGQHIQLYLCQDKDAFIFTKTVLNRQFMQAAEEISEYISPISLESITQIYDVNQQWPELETLAQAKHQSLSQLAASSAAQKSFRHVKSIVDSLDPSHIKSIAKRRTARTNAMVMVADDDQLSRTLVRNVLSQEYLLSSAQDGLQTVQRYIHEAPDVLFLDIGMPGLDGHQALELLLQLDDDAYIIMFSGRKDRENIVKALESGAQGFVGKPFTRGKLLEYIRQSPHVIQKSSTHTMPKAAS